MKLILSIILISILTACSTKPYIVKQDPITENEARNNDIYVVSHEWHTGFVIPSKLIINTLPTLGQRFGDSPYIEFGWGDKGFYQANEITSGLTVQAIFWPTESVIHAVAVPNRIRRYFPRSEIVSIYLTDNEFDSLIKFIENSFQKNENGGIIELKNGIYGNSQFYKAVGDYYLMNTCNKWTAKGLKSAGFDIDTTFKLTKDSILNFLNNEY